MSREPDDWVERSECLLPAQTTTFLHCRTKFPRSVSILQLDFDATASGSAVTPPFSFSVRENLSDDVEHLFGLNDFGLVPIAYLISLCLFRFFPEED